MAHPDRLLDQLTSSQLTEWMAYAAIEPFGPQRDDLRAGVISATVANVSRGQDVPPYAPEDFMPSLKEPQSDVVNMDPEALSLQIIALIKKGST